MTTLAMNPHLPPGNFYGKTLRQHLVAGFSLSETRYPPGTKLPRHSHESSYFGFVLRGNYTENYGNTVRSCYPLMVAYHPAGELHEQYFNRTTVSLFRIELDYARLDLDQIFKLDGCDFRAGLPVVLVGKLYKEFSEPDELSDVAITGLGLELIAEIARRNRARDSIKHPPLWLQQARDLVQSRFLEHLTLREIAIAVGVHPVTLAREFHRHYGYTVGEILRRERIEFACQLLKSEESLANIATAAGFYDQSHFAKAFKRLMGMTPTQYRTSFLPNH